MTPEPMTPVTGPTGGRRLAWRIGRDVAVAAACYLATVLGLQRFGTGRFR